MIFRPPLRGRTQLGAARGRAAFFALALQFFGALDVAAVFLYRNVAAVLVCRWPEAGEAQGKHAHKQNSTRHLHSFIGMWNNKIHFTYS